MTCHARNLLGEPLCGGSHTIVKSEDKKMTNATNRINNDRQTVRLFLCTKEAAKAIEFYKKAFGAEELTRSAEPDGRIGRAEVRIGNSRLLIADEYPEAPEMKGVRSPQSLGGSSMHICL